MGGDILGLIGNQKAIYHPIKLLEYLRIKTINN